ncbi:MFS transporter [Siccirubricoccus deserti]|uniref:MFS transporter n=1 Tax=Siccirubricoccus deserti TaxID=2013562 RepID=A0A9X0UCE4_9PROT|nr:MFS transporter [Siccirubricoccus deserti]MBC4014351.1 MFS transporter [Siccirubricoccus deserti]GGC33493.1 MFS transporter [Siccirubricoccus deserti]
MARDRPASIVLIVLAQVLALSLWFSGTAAGPAMAREAAVPPGFLAWLTGGVQAGFVLGTLASAALALPDRVDPRRLIAAACLFGATANALILALPVGDPWVVVARGATGLALACVYPVGMKLAAGWAGPGDAGLVVGLLVGGLTLGSGAPHLVNALGGLEWRVTVAAASLAALLAAGLVLAVRLGPRHAKAPPFRPGLALLLFRNRGTRLATLGYLGHMWELYAMWAWVGAYLAASFLAWGSSAPGGPALASFAVMAAGSLGCVAGGLLADRIGRARLTIWAMATSALCCLLAGPAFGLHPALVMTLCLVWGAAVVADSAQFSTSVAELAPPGLAGTMLTVQTCLGFALTLPAIHLLPWVEARLGWGGGAFAVLAVGPALGCLAMARLLPARQPWPRES